MNIFHFSDKLAPKSSIHLCAVVCGNRTDEVLTMLKSAIMVTPHTAFMIFHIVSEPSIQKNLRDHVSTWALFSLFC